MLLFGRNHGHLLKRGEVGKGGNRAKSKKRRLEFGLGSGLTPGLRTQSIFVRVQPIPASSSSEI